MLIRLLSIKSGPTAPAMACLLVLCVALTGTALIASPVSSHALDCTTPIEVPPRPDLKKGQDYGTWVVKIMKYKQLKREHEEHARQCPDLYAEGPQEPADPRIISKPETIQEALARSQKFVSFDYGTHKTWYNRSTSRTFSLPSLPGSEMSEASLLSSLASLSQPEPGSVPAGFGMLIPGFLRDGQEASEEDERMLGFLVINQETGLDQAFSIYPNQPRLSDVVSDGKLTLFLDQDDNAYKVHADIFYENCLSSCVLYGR